MRRLLIAAVLVSAALPPVALVASLAFAQDMGNKLPFNPWENAREGDWEMLAVETKFEGRQAAILKDRFTKLESVTYRIRGVDAAEVKVSFDTVPDVMEQEERIATIFSRTETPRFDRLLDVKSDVTDVKYSDEKRRIGGREFLCTKIAYTTTTTHGFKAQNAVWFAKDVKTFGLVELVTEIPLDEGTRATITYRVAGFGTKDKLEFGKMPPVPKK
jgi:hypothetical protein